MLRQLFVLGLLLAVTYGSAGNPFSPGPMRTASIDVTKQGQLPYDFIVAAPVMPGSYPVIFFLPGLAGDAYTEFINLVTAHGIMLVSVSSFPSLPTDDVAAKFAQTIDWAKENMNNILATTIPGVSANFSSLALMGHSAGSKMVVKLLETSCSGVSAAILLNPVDGSDPWGLIKDYVIHPPNKLNYDIPTLIYGSGRGPAKANPAFPACAPKGMNYPRFFNASNCGTWMIEGVEWGHADLLNDFFLEAVADVCAMNENKNALWREYRTFLAGITTAFVQGILLEECSMLNYLNNASSYPKYVGTMNFGANLNGCSACNLPGCSS